MDGGVGWPRGQQETFLPVGHTHPPACPQPGGQEAPGRGPRVGRRQPWESTGTTRVGVLDSACANPPRHPDGDVFTLEVPDGLSSSSYTLTRKSAASRAAWPQASSALASPGQDISAGPWPAPPLPGGESLGKKAFLDRKP